MTKGFEWFRQLTGAETTASDRAGLPERECQSFSEQMSAPLEQISHNWGEYFDFLKNKVGVGIDGDQTKMLPYQIDPAWGASISDPDSAGEDGGLVQLGRSSHCVSEIRTVDG